MGMVVRTNTMALNAYRQLGLNNSAVAKSLEKLASGYRINRAGDDAAGLAISEKMKAQITGLETASANAQDGISLIQTAEGNLSEVHDMLNRMVELATKSANGTYTSTERDALQAEVTQLLDEIDRISQSANFNGAKLLDGTMGLNNEAFSIGTSTGATTAGEQKIDPSKINVPTDHDSPAGSQVAPKFTVNFSEYAASFKAMGTNPGSATVTFTNEAGDKIQKWDAVGNKWTDYSLTLAAAANAGDAVSIDASDLQGLFADNAIVKIGNDAYKVSGSAAGSVTFTWQGTAKNDGTADTTAKVTDTTWTPTGAITVGLTGDGANVETAATLGTGVRADCDVTKVDDPVVGGDKLRAGATLTLDADMVKAGSTIKIGDTTYTFTATGAKDGLQDGGSKTAGYTINVGDRNGAELLQFVSEQMSNTTAQVTKPAEGANAAVAKEFTVNREGTDKIHIDEVPDAADPKYAGFTAAQMKDSFKVITADANASTTFNVIDNDKMSNEESISIDGKDYKFAKGATATDTLNNLKTALGSNYTATVNGSSITIAANAATDPAPVLTGSGLTLQIGDTAEEFNKMTVGVPNMSAKGLGLDGLTVANQTAAATAIDDVKDAINQVSTVRANMGALQNRLEHTINNLDVAAENLSAANSRIRDTDMAKEMMNYTKMNVLVQSAQAMLAQANQQPQSVLQLLQ